MLNSKYAPKSIHDYGSKDLNANFQGKLFSVDKGTSKNLDLLVTDDSLVDGGSIIATNVCMGDKISCRIVDVDNILGGGAGLVLNEFVTDWYMIPDKTLPWDFTVPYPAKIYGGLYIRIIYTSIGAINDVDVAINYKLHKVLW